MKQMEVTILGNSYVLSCPDGGEKAMLEAVGKVDREMSAIRDAGKVKARDRIAVLAALNLAYSPAGRKPEQASVAPPVSVAAVDVDDLVRRLNQVLEADGQLL